MPEPRSSVRKSNFTSNQAIELPNGHSPHAAPLLVVQTDARPVQRQRERLRGFTRRLRQRHQQKWHQPSANSNQISTGLPKRWRRKRKAALAISAAAMSVGGGALASTISARTLDFSHSVETTVPDPSSVRVSVHQLTSSQELKEALAQEEGVRLTVYRDAGGLPTVGVGHRVTAADGLTVGDKISYDQAIDLLERDLADAETIVRGMVGELPLFQHEFDALIDLVYNVGEGTVSPSRSPALNRAIAVGDYEAIAEQLVYRRAGGRFAPGLAYRSERRQSIFLEASYTDPRPHEVALANPPGLVMDAIS